MFKKSLGKIDVAGIWEDSSRTSRVKTVRDRSKGF